MRNQCVASGFPTNSGPPDPESRSPAAGGTASGAKQKCRGKTTSKKYNRSETISTLTVTAGRDRIGYLESDGRRFAAYDCEGNQLGAFPSMKAAADAVSAAHLRTGTAA